MSERRLLLISEQATEILRLRAENEKLRAALKPFADAAERNLGPDDSRIVGDCTLGDLRAASAALKERGEGMNDKALSDYPTNAQLEVQLKELRAENQKRMFSEIMSLRAENEKLRAVLKEVSVCLDGERTGEDVLSAVRAAAAALKED